MPRSDGSPTLMDGVRPMSPAIKVAAERTPTEVVAMKRTMQVLVFSMVLLVAPWVNAQGSHGAYEIVPGVQAGVVAPGMTVDDAAHAMSAYGKVYRDDDGDPRVDFEQGGSFLIVHPEGDPANVERAVVSGEPAFTVRGHPELRTGIAENPERGATIEQWVTAFGEPDDRGPLPFGGFLIWQAGIAALFDCTHGQCGTVAIAVFAQQ